LAASLSYKLLTLSAAGLQAYRHPSIPAISKRYNLKAINWPHLLSGKQTNNPHRAAQTCQMNLTPEQIATQYVELLFFFLQYIVYFVDKPFYELYGTKNLSFNSARKIPIEIDYQRQK
jgi:hypothetical protein